MPQNRTGKRHRGNPEVLEEIQVTNPSTREKPLSMPVLEAIDPLLLPRQLADRWSVTTGHLRNLRYQRRGVPFLKLGGRVAYRTSDVLSFENARLVTTDDLDSFTGSRSRDRNRA